MSIWTAKVITSIPSIFPGALGHSVIGQALKEGKWALEVINLREFANDERGSIDDSPFGGGPGMILRPDVVEKAIKKALENVETDLPLVYMTPVGKPLIQKRIKELSNGQGIIVLCGRFEGVDERVLDAYNFERISIGDFVLTGGEVAAMTIIEGCTRLLENVVGKKESLQVESFNESLLEYPQYTRPQIWVDEMNHEHKVPDVLVSGNHEKIRKWKKNKSLEKTKNIRPDLLNKRDS